MEVHVTGHQMRTLAAWDAEELTPDLFSQLVQAGNAFQICDGMNDWPALKTWGHPDYLPSIIGDRNTTVWHQDGNGSLRTTAMSFRDFSGEMFSEDAPHCYLPEVLIKSIGQDINGPFAPLARDIRFPDYLKQFEPLLVSFFAGRDAASVCHYHAGEDNILCQVAGTKRVICFPSTGLDLFRLYPRPWYSGTFNFSRVQFPWDGSWPVADNFPDLAKAARMEIVMRPGDILFIPVYCWHVAYSKGPSISVAVFWKSSWAKRYLTLRGFRSNYLNYRKLKVSIGRMRSRIGI